MKHREIERLERQKLGPAGRIAATFLESKLTPLLVVVALLAGAFAVAITPREEEPQIQVPMIDVFLGLPGAPAAEIERRVVGPVEKALFEIDGVEFVYSTSQPSGGLVIVRFLVGTDPDQAVVRVHAKLAELTPELPSGALPPVVAPRSIDDVPVLAYTLHSRTSGPLELRRVAAEVRAELARHPRVAEVTLIGGARRVVRVDLDREAMAARRVSPLQVHQALAGLNQRLPAGTMVAAGREVEVEVGSLFRDAGEVGAAVVGVSDGRAVFLRDVARVADGADDPVDYVWLLSREADAPAVTLAIAKKPGTNAIDLVADLDRQVEEMTGTVIPGDVEVLKTRDYGFTADEKSSELIKHLWIATLAVVALMALALGRREALVVLVAVPTTLALTLAASYLFGYTLNRVTLFALIFAIGILVDDAIVVVENIYRHYRLSGAGTDVEVARRATVEATDEVGNPTILATLTVIAALLPLAFVSGLMGPYMRPIPINASAAMLFSLAVAFVVTPWLTFVLFKRSARRQERRRAAAERGAERGAEAGEDTAAVPDGHRRGAGHGHDDEGVHETRFHRLYAAVMTPLLNRRAARWTVLATVVLLLLGAVALFPLRAVTVKMLPFDNKSEVQVVIDMPEGSTLEQTAGLARRLGEAALGMPEVTDVEIYAGTSAPFNYNGLVRHYFLRYGPAVADLQVNLLPKHHRDRASHPFSRELRERLAPVAAGSGASVKVTEVPPGPPVLSTMVAEIYGPDPERRIELAERVKGIFEETDGVVDVDWYVEAAAPRLELVVDREKAARAGVSPEAIVRTVRVALAGGEAGLLRDPAAREPVPLRLRLARDQRTAVADLLGLDVHGAGGAMVPLGELVRVEETAREPFLYHKNLQPLTYVIGEVAGAEESPVYAILGMQRAISSLEDPLGRPVPVLSASMPEAGTGYAIKWDGEWQITYEVFRDMGIAFAAVLVLIYALVVGWFKSFATPLVIMAPIPLALVGILPAHALGGVFFTATSMIGFIALAGIIVRNSILLVDFIDIERAAGASLTDAVIQAGIVRFRPIVLTAAALVVGGLVILLDPIFQGLAVSLIAGVVASTALTLVVIPVLYYMQLQTVSPAPPS